jgi:hypothetical protein
MDKITFEVVRNGDEFELTINGTRHFVGRTLDLTLEIISETLLEEHSVIPF